MKRARNRIQSTTRRTLAFAAVAGCAILPLGSASHGAVSSWLNPVNGSWTDAGKWNTLPTPTSDVIINATGGAYTVSLYNANATVNSLTIDSPLATYQQYHDSGVLPDRAAVLTVGTINVARGTFQAASELRNAHITVGAGGTFMSQNAGLTGVTFDGGIAGFQTTTITNNLTLNNATTVRTRLFGSGVSDFTNITFNGTQSLLGNGTISFEERVPVRSSNGTLTIDNGITIANGAANGAIGGSYSAFGQETTDAWRNRGTIRAQGAGRNMYLMGNWRNEGTMTVDVGATLVLGGHFKTDDIGTIQNAGGGLQIGGVLDNAGTTLDIASIGTCSFGPDTGVTKTAIVGGTIKGTDAAQLVVTNVGKLLDVTIDGSMGVLSGQARNLTLANGATLKLMPGGRLDLGFGTLASDHQTLAGNGQVLFQGGQLYDYNATVTIGPGITLRATTSGGSIKANDFTNNGTISAQTPGESLLFDPVSSGTFVNHGFIRATNGGSFQIRGNIPAGGLGNFDSTGGTLTLAAQLQNTGNTIALSGMKNVLYLGSATVTGGRITADGGAELRVNSSSSGAYFFGVQLDSDLVVADTADVYFRGNTTLENGHRVRFTGSQSTLDLFSTAPAPCLLAGNGEVVYEATDDSGGTLIANQTLVIGSGIAVRDVGTSLAIGGQGAQPYVLNHGTISMEATARTLQIGDVISDGRLRVSNGTFDVIGAMTNRNILDVSGGTMSLAAGWDNSAGTINLTGGALVLRGEFNKTTLGQFNHAGGGAAIVAGNFDNAANTINIAAAKPWQLIGQGKISGGSIASSDGTPLRVLAGAASLDGVSLAANVRIDDGTLSLVNMPTASLAGDSFTIASSAANRPSQLQLPWTGTLNDATVVFAGTPTSVVNDLTVLPTTPPLKTTLTIGEATLVRTDPNSVGRINAPAHGLLNLGTISARDGGKITISTGTFANGGTIEAVNGGTILISNSTVLVDPPSSPQVLHDGTWRVTGPSAILFASANVQITDVEAEVILDGPLSRFPALAPLSRNGGTLRLLNGRDFVTAGTFENAGMLEIGTDSELTVTGAFLLSQGSVLSYALNESSAASVSRLASTSGVTLDGSLNVTLAPTFAPAMGDTFTLLNGGLLTGTFSSVVLPSLGSELEWHLAYSDHAVTLQVVPEPFAASLIGVAIVAVRRHRRRA